MTEAWIDGDQLFFMGDEAPADNDAQYCADQYCQVLQEAVSALVKMRITPETAPCVSQNEGRLLASLASLQLLCSELRGERVVVPFRQVK